MHLTSSNEVDRMAANIEGNLEFRNRKDLEIAPIEFESGCTGFTESLAGLDVAGLTIILDGLPASSLTDADNAVTTIQTYANFDVNGDILLGENAAVLQFTDHSIVNLLGQNSSDAFVQIAATNASLFVDSSIVLADVFVLDTFFIDTIENNAGHGSDGDILQSMVDDETSSLIHATNAAFVSNSSVQLTNTHFDRLAIFANENYSDLIQPFVLNKNLGSTFTGSIDASVFSDMATDSFLLNGTSSVDGVFDVEESFIQHGFFAGNNEFVNANQIGIVVINNPQIELIGFDQLGLNAVQLENVTSVSEAIFAKGDIYLETSAGDLTILANVVTTEISSNITVVSGNDVNLNNNAELQRLDNSNVIGLVNTIQTSFIEDHFILVDPRSVLVFPGDTAFSDLNAQLDSAIGFQSFELFFGNTGERSFNVIVGWFVEGVTPGNAINANFQQTLLQAMNQTTGDFLLSDFINFGQPISAFSIDMDSITLGESQPLTLTNTSQFQQAFFADASFLLSQIFVTNDARINLFADGGKADLNFSQEVLPTRTVVQNPTVIVVETPSISIPETPAVAPQPLFNYVNLIQDPESPPLLTEPPSNTYFVIKFTADDDGVFEESFTWNDVDDDPDAIRNAIERAQLVDESFWSQQGDNREINWTDEIKNQRRVKPGLYYIFEFEEGQLVPEPADAPVDRTDIENIVAPEESETSLNEEQNALPDFRIESGFDTIPTIGENISELSTQEKTGNHSMFLASTLLLGQWLMQKQNNVSSALPAESNSRERNLFSRAARFKRRANRI